MIQQIIELVKESKTELAINKLISVIEGRSRELYSSAILLRSRYHKNEKDFREGLIARDNYEISNNKIILSLINTTIDSADMIIEKGQIHELNKMKENLAGAINRLKMQIISNTINDGEISNQIGIMIIDEIESYLHPDMIELMGSNPYYTECSDFVCRMRKKIEEVKNAQNNA